MPHLGVNFSFEILVLNVRNHAEKCRSAIPKFSLPDGHLLKMQVLTHLAFQNASRQPCLDKVSTPK